MEVEAAKEKWEAAKEVGEAVEEKKKTMKTKEDDYTNDNMHHLMIYRWAGHLQTKTFDFCTSGCLAAILVVAPFSFLILAPVLLYPRRTTFGAVKISIDSEPKAIAFCKFSNLVLTPIPWRSDGDNVERNTVKKDVGNGANSRREDQRLSLPDGLNKDEKRGCEVKVWKWKRLRSGSETSESMRSIVEYLSIYFVSRYDMHNLLWWSCSALYASIGLVFPIL